MPWTDACDAEDVADDEIVPWEHADRAYAIYCTEAGEVFVTDGLCPQDGAHLAGGILSGYLVECPLHHGRFDIRTGAMKGAPDGAPLATYPARVAAGRVLVDVAG